MINIVSPSGMPTTRDARTADQCVSVLAPARLHLGFMDLHGGLGRSFGSLGLTVSTLATVVEAEPAATLAVEGPEAARAQRIAERLAAHHGTACRGRITVRQAIPAHVGLGSGTQLALAVGTALAAINGWPATPRDIAAVAARGARSGIGIGAFETGGFLVDGGKGDDDALPPVIARSDFPEDWRILLIFDRRRAGIHGSSESSAFAALPRFPADAAAGLCRLVLMQLLPALAAADLGRFGEAVGTLQRVVGDHFAPAQGGRFTSPAVSAALAWLANEGIAGIGQSSWGPTGFAIVADEEQGQALLRHATTRWGARGELSFMLCAGRNSGALIEQTVRTGSEKYRRQIA